MIDINLFRKEKGGDPEIVRESQRRRYAPLQQVEDIIDLDQDWRKCRFKLDELNKEQNKIQNEIKVKIKAKEDTKELIQKKKDVEKQKALQIEEENQAILKRDKQLQKIGNLVHDSVPISDNEDNNTVLKHVGTLRNEKKEEKLYNHYDLVQLLDIVDLEGGQNVAGNRGFFLKGPGVLLNLALQNFAIQFGVKMNYEPIYVPFFMRKDIMAECAQLEDFDEQLYHLVGEGDDKYLIATSEQPLCALHRNKWIEPKQLPIRYIGMSTCFRKETGSHGRDTLGIFRVHQFEKIEQFCVTSPFEDNSWKMLNEMLQNAEDFYQALGIPYRVVNIVSGALNDAAAKKYDLEAWFPASQAFRELCSCSNCTDYQARRLGIRLRSGQAVGGDQVKHHVHLLNATLTATERTMCCILENYQTDQGVKIPEILKPYMAGIDFIPFKKQFDKKGKLVNIDSTIQDNNTQMQQIQNGVGNLKISQQ